MLLSRRLPLAIPTRLVDSAKNIKLIQRMLDKMKLLSIVCSAIPNAVGRASLPTREEMRVGRGGDARSGLRGGGRVPRGPEGREWADSGLFGHRAASRGAPLGRFQAPAC